MRKGSEGQISAEINNFTPETRQLFEWELVCLKYKTLGLSNKQRYALQFLHMYKLNMFLTRGRITGDFTERKQQISALNKKRFDARRFH